VSSPTPPHPAQRGRDCWRKMGAGGGGGGRLYSCLMLELCTLCNSDMCTLQLCILFFSLSSLFSVLSAHICTVC
jgi:hypothetical protein